MPEFFFRIFNKINNKRMARSIRNACRQLEFDNVILFNDNDFFRAQYLPELLNTRYFIYYIRDLLINQQYFKKHGAKHEISIIKKADLIVANSSYLANYAARYNKHSKDIGQGCDFTYFKPGVNYAEPEDLKKIPHPRVGYVGALVSFRLDIDLLIQMAAAKPEWSWVLVGPEDEAFGKSRLHEMNNVFFLGRKNETELAGYVSHFDVCINPQLVNEVTIGNYPRKVDEYLAMGKPVVATFTDFMKSFGGYVYLCSSADEYIQAIHSALESAGDKGLQQRRSAFALTHTWENSVKKIYESIKV
jgi:glycosyltransferase involved in cell wall biosynthesis